MDQREPLKGADQGEARLHSSLRSVARPELPVFGATSRLIDHRRSRVISECGAWAAVCGPILRRGAGYRSAFLSALDRHSPV